MIRRNIVIRTTSGFSLLEIMLVIVVMSVLLLAGMRYLQAQADEFKVTAAAHELRLWLEAAYNYHDKHKEWPKSASNLRTENPGVLKTSNPWGAAITTGTVGGKHSKFVVTTVVPDQELARRLRANLGFADIKHGTTVAAYTNADVDPHLNNNLLIKNIKSIDGTGSGLGSWDLAAGDGSSGDSRLLRKSSTINHDKLRNKGKILIPVPQCPVGMNPGYEVTLSGFQKGCLQTRPFNVGNWFCSPTVNSLWVKSAFTRSVGPYQTQQAPVSTSFGNAWEVWVQTLAESNKGVPVEPWRWGPERSLPNYHGALTYMTYCQGEARA